MSSLVHAQALVEHDTQVVWILAELANFDTWAKVELRQALQKLSDALILLAQEVGASLEAPPPTYLPAPYRPGRSHGRAKQEITGSKAVLFAILHRAAADWVLYRTSRRLLLKQLAQEAFIWIFQEGPGHNFWQERTETGKQATSFLAICEALDFDAESVRERIKKLSPQQIISMGRPAEYRRRPVLTPEGYIQGRARG